VLFASSFCESLTALDGRRIELLLLLSSFDEVLLISVIFLGRLVGDGDGGGDGGDREGNYVLSSILMRLSYVSSLSSSSLLSSSHKLIIPVESDALLPIFGPASGLFRLDLVV
jgi:hypothetical protein